MGCVCSSLRIPPLKSQCLAKPTHVSAIFSRVSFIVAEKWRWRDRGRGKGGQGTERTRTPGKEAEEKDLRPARRASHLFAFPLSSTPCLIPPSFSPSPSPFPSSGHSRCRCPPPLALLLPLPYPLPLLLPPAPAIAFVRGHFTRGVRPASRG